VREAFLDVLQCPLCGGGLSLDKRLVPDAPGGISVGTLTCECNGYPVVAGIPYIRIGKAADRAMQLLDEGEPEQALLGLLGLDEAREPEFKRLSAGGHRATFRETLELLCEDVEAPYLLFRFSDPTFVASDAVTRAVGEDSRCFSKRALDLCGGAGHLTRSLCSLSQGADVVLADISFWKLWLAKQFVAPECQPVCCDANVPLPFARDAFSFVGCSDALHYIWSKRGLASEVSRLVGDAGVILLLHLHNVLSWNYSEGAALSPRGYKRLLEDRPARLFPESTVLDAVLDGAPINLSTECEPSQLTAEPALMLVSTRWDNFFRVYPQPPQPPPGRSLSRPTINPLYEVERRASSWVLNLRFPSKSYELEYESSKRYLPERVELAEDRLSALNAGSLDAELRELAERRVLLNLPQSYV
jgi:SAM-dependent methyltransferase/uncharacterized protein YbaR (Trm112 family)